MDEELAWKKRELEELNEMIARRKAMVAMESRGGMMDMRPMEKTCIDYDHGRIAVPITEYKPMKSILKKHTENVSGPLFPIKPEPHDHDQYRYNPPTLDHIQSFDSPEHSHLLYTQTSSKKAYYDEQPYEQTSAQHNFYQSQSHQTHHTPVNTGSTYQSPTSQLNPNQLPPAQLTPHQTLPSQPPPHQSSPSQPCLSQTPLNQSPFHQITPRPPSPGQPLASKHSPPPSQKSAHDEKHNLTTQISRFLNILNKGVDASLLSTVVKEAQDEKPFMAEKTPDEYDSCRTTDHSQDDLLPHERAIQDGSGFSRIVGMAQEQYSGSAYQKETSLNEDEKFLYRGKAPASDEEHYKRSSGSVERLKQDREGKSPTRETREGSKSRPEHFEKIQSLLRTIGLNVDSAEVSKLADRTQKRLYGKCESSSSELSDRERGHLSSRRQDRRRSRTGSTDSERLKSISPVGLSSQEPYSGHKPSSEYGGFLDREEEEALEKARQMQSLTKTVRKTPDQTIPTTPNPIPVTSSFSHYPHQLPVTSYLSMEYNWHSGTSSQYPMPPSSTDPSLCHEAPVTYNPAGYPPYVMPVGHPPNHATHYYRQHEPPPVGSPPISSYLLHPLTGASTVSSTSLTSPLQVNTQVTLSAPTSDAATTSISRCLKVIETVKNEIEQKELPKVLPKVVQFSLPPTEATQLHATSTKDKQASSGTEDDIKAKQKKRLEQFNQRMMEKSKQLRLEKIKDFRARKKNLNIPPGKVINTEPKNIWICGHSLIYWAEMRAKSPEVGMQLGMDPSSVVVWWKGTQGMTWPQLLPQLLQLKIKWPNPDVVIMHLGGNDLGTDSPTDLLASVKKDLTSMRSIFPQCLLVWSDILPRRVWRHSEDSLEVDLVRATINRRVHSIIAELGGTALTHDNLRCGTDTGLYRPDGVHLSGKGIDTYNLNLQDFLEKWEIEANPATDQS